MKMKDVLVCNKDQDYNIEMYPNKNRIETLLTTRDRN